MTPKLENSLSGLEKQAEFSKKYNELIESFLTLKRVSMEVGIDIKQVSLEHFWNVKYPELEKDMMENGFCEEYNFKLLGIKISG